jgi:hypothetical protein
LRQGLRQGQCGEEGKSEAFAEHGVFSWNQLIAFQTA